jgi:hypothetical protein
MAAPFSGESKQMFQNIEVNTYIPKDPKALHSCYKMMDVLEDDPDTMERCIYHVSGYPKCLAELSWSYYGVYIPE